MLIRILSATISLSPSLPLSNVYMYLHTSLFSGFVSSYVQDASLACCLKPTTCRIMPRIKPCRTQAHDHPAKQEGKIWNTELKTLMEACNMLSTSIEAYACNPIMGHAGHVKLPKGLWAAGRAPREFARILALHVKYNTKEISRTSASQNAKLQATLPKVCFTTSSHIRLISYPRI